MTAARDRHGDTPRAATTRDRAHDAARDTAGQPDLVRGFIDRLRRDMLRYLPAAVLPAAFSVAAVAVFTRIFGADSYGRYALVMAGAVIVASIAAGWIQQSILRFLPRYREEGRGAAFMSRLSGMLAVLVSAWGVVLVAGYLFAGPWMGAYRPFYIPAAGLVLGEMVFLACITSYQSLLRSGEYALYRILAYGLRLVLSLAYVYFLQRDVVGLVVGSVGAYALLLPVMMLRLRSTDTSVGRVSFDPTFFRMFAAYGVPMMGWMLGGQILGIADRIVIGAFRDAGEVGIYAANYTLVTMALGLLSSPIVMAAHPIIMSAWERRVGADISRLVTVFSRYYLIAVIPFVAAVAVFSREVATLFLGSEFREGHVIVPLVMSGVAVWGLGVYGHKALELLERTRTMLAIVAVSATLNIVLNVVFVPGWGYRAAAWTTLVSYTTYPFVVWFVTRSTPMPWRLPVGTLVRALIASAVMVATMLAVRAWAGAALGELPTAVAGSLAGAAAFGLVLWVTGEWRSGIGSAVEDDGDR